MNKQYPIDLVYLWVDGSDKEWLEKKQKYIKIENKPLSNESLYDCRFRENDELKYSLRSVEKYLPWINKIYIVTDNQIPEWLDTDNPKIKVVFHQDFMPQEILPTFNSSVIELYLHKIPNLSEHFLYANDDMFVNAKLSPDFFFDDENKPIVRVSYTKLINSNKDNIYRKYLIHTKDLIYKKYHISYNLEPHHNIDAYTKSIYENCSKEFPDEFKKANRFRTQDDTNRSIISFYAIATKKAKLKRIKRPGDNKFINILKCRYFVDSMYMENFIIKIQKYYNSAHTKLFCINDVGGTEQDLKGINNMLHNMFPQKSSFEKSSNDLMSIIIPVYNTEKYLNKCLNSVINQTYKNLEIICINDGSNDNSINILNEYAKKDSRIKVINQENQGVSKARNTGIEISKGKYLTFIDSDDWIEPNTIEEVLKTAQSNYSDIVIFSHYDVFGNRKKPYRYKVKETYFKYKTADDYIKSKIMRFPGVSWAKFYKKEFIKDLRFNENLTISEDQLFWYDVLYLKPSITLLKEPLYNYLNERPLSSISDIKNVCKNHEKFIEASKQTPLYKNSKVKPNILDRNLNLFCWMWLKHKSQREYIIQQTKPYMDEIKKFKWAKGLRNYKQMKKNIRRYKNRHISAFMQEIFSVRYDKSKEHKYITILGCKVYKKEKK